MQATLTNIKGQQAVLVSDAEHRRCNECPSRFPNQCKLVNDVLGYANVMSLSDCDRCWAAGGEKGGADVRSAYTSLTIEFMRRPENFKRLPPDVQRSFAAKHMEEGEAARLIAESPRPLPTVRVSGWPRAKATFAAADSFIRSMKSRGLTGRKVALTIKGERHLSCFGRSSQEGPQVSEPCPALAEARDGRHYCNECLCGETELAMLDGEGYTKLDYPYLVCPRRRKGFSNEHPAYTAFERAVCVSLRRRPDRWRKFKAAVDAMEWPLPDVRRFEAVDGALAPHPDIYMSGNGAWGCLRSHTRILEEALMDGISSIVVFEDDAWFVPDFADRFRDFMERVPEDWEGLMLGGQHIGWPKVKPRLVKEGVYRCVNCQRTHAYAVRGKLLRDLYKRWAGWQPHFGSGHADIVMGPFMANYNVYAPEEFLVAQDEGASDINGASNPRKYWDLPKGSEPVVFLATSKRPDPNRLRRAGYHMGYDVDQQTGMDKGVLAISKMPAAKRAEEWEKWLFVVQGEAVSIKARACVWAPYMGAEDEVRSAAGTAFVRLEEPKEGAA